MKRAVLLGLLSLNLTAFGQSTSDSTKLYSLPVWQFWHYVKAYDDLPKCYKTLEQFEIALDEANVSIQAGQGVITNLETRLGNSEIIASNYEQAFQVERELRKQETKHLKKQKFKLTLIAIGQAVVIVLLII